MGGCVAGSLPYLSDHLKPTNHPLHLYSTQDAGVRQTASQLLDEQPRIGDIKAHDVTTLKLQIKERVIAGGNSALIGCTGRHNDLRRQQEGDRSYTACVCE